MNSGNRIVTRERVGTVAVIRIDNPPVNATSHAVRAGLSEAIKQAGADTVTQAVLIVAVGKVFVSGADIREFGKPRLAPLMPDITLELESLDKPVVAAIQGSALGGGFELALACHYRVAAAGIKVGLPEVKLGLIPGAGGTQRLPRLIGVSSALEMIATGRLIDTSSSEAGLLFDAIAGELPVEEAGLRFCQALLDQGAGPRRVRDIELDPTVDVERTASNFVNAQGAKFHLVHAPQAAVEAVKAAKLPFLEGLKVERSLFSKLETDPQSGALRYQFFAEREAGKIAGTPSSSRAADISNVGVVGGGTMGTGIATAFADAGIPVCLIDMSSEAADRARANIEQAYASSVKRGRIAQEEAETRLKRISFGTNAQQLCECDLIIEAVFEDMEVKKKLLEELSAVVKEDAILATNTSYLDVNNMAASVSRPERFLGLHFFSPAHIMKLIEVVRGDATSLEVVVRSLKLAKRLGKIPVVVGVGYGFVGNRMLSLRQREANRLIVEGAEPSQVDGVLERFGFPMGPFAMADMAGLDIGMTPSRRLEMPIRAVLMDVGRLGQKSGAGFYDYMSSRERHPSPVTSRLTEAYAQEHGIVRRQIEDAEIFERCIYTLINEGARILEEGKASRGSDIDVVWVNGYGWPAWTGGPMYYADSIGLADIVSALDCYSAQRGDGFAVAPLLRRLAAEGGKLSAFVAEKVEPSFEEKARA